MQSTDNGAGSPARLSRRGFVSGTLFAVPALAFGAAAYGGAGARRLELLDDPAFNVRAFARLASTLEAGATGYVHYLGKAWGVDCKGANKALYGIEGLAAIRTEPGDDGAIRMLFSEAAIYTDLASGQPLKRWENPYTGETVDVWHQRNGPVNFTLRPVTTRPPGPDGEGGAEFTFSLPWRVTGDVATFAQDIRNERPNPITAERFPEYSTGPTLPISEHSQYRVDLDALLDESLPSLDYFAALQSIKPWHPWMRMGPMPGRVFTRMTSQPVGGVSGLSPDVRRFAEETLADYLVAPTRWTGEYRDAYTIFRDTLVGDAAGMEESEQ